MAKLQMGLQVVTWRWTPSGFRCEGYVGIPSPVPAFVVLWPTGSQASIAVCSRIGAVLAQRLAALPGARRAPHLPCSGGPFPAEPLGLVPAMAGCHAYDVTGVRKLLVVVGDPCAPLVSVPTMTGNWLQAGDDSFRLLVALPSGSSPAALMPPEWRYQEAVFWDADPEEVVPEILRAAGVEESERRIFLSYVRKESSEVAEQLFDELNRRGFDVYLDRFRGTPGTDFRQRLVRELAHKSMVILLASPSVLQSKWTLYEILFARLYGLGMFALDMSAAFSGPSVIARLPLVRSEVRPLDPAEIARPIPTLELNAPAVTALVDEIVAAHTQALLARRHRLVLTVDALLRHVGAHVDAVDPSGQVLARSNAGSGPSKSYSIRVSPRPAELTDFHRSFSLACGATPVVAAPASWENGTVRDAMDWLENTSGIPLIEEGEWLRAARDVRGGVL